MPECYLTSQKIKQFSDLFMHFDYYSTGTIHYTSLKEIMNSMTIQMNDDDIMSIIADTGNQNPTMIKLDQFLAIVSILVEDKEMKQEISTIFKILDADKSKRINQQDIKKALTHIGLAYNQQQIIDMLKKSKKQSLSFQQFQQFILKDI